jgi:hypothetical protein
MLTPLLIQSELFMRRCPLTLLLCAVVLVFTPASAHAQFWQWIDELSGPGPLQGPVFEWKLTCFGDQPDPTPRGGRGEALAILGPGCLTRPVPPRMRRGSVNIAFGLLNADENPLRYANPQQDRNVDLTFLEPSIWWSPAIWVDTGVGGGIMWFSGAGFPSFRRVFFEPIRVNLKLLTLLGRTRSEDPPEWLDAFSVRASAIVIPRGFRAEDFGAIPGTFQTSREVLRSFAVAADFEPIVRYLRR